MKRVQPRANARHIVGMLNLASAADIEQGISWYQRAYDLSVRLIHTYPGLRLGQAIGVIAALSPNNNWVRNVIDAEAMIKLWHQGVDPRTAKVCTFNRNKDKAARILELESVDTEAIQTILSGQKVIAFFRCISGFTDTVCVDGHAFAIFMGERIPTTQTPSISKSLYAAITRSYILAANKSYDVCGVKLTAAQVQAVTWVTYRRMLGYAD